MIMPMHIPIEVITAVISALVTYTIGRVVTNRRTKQINQLAEKIENMFIALCNANGYGDIFIREYEKITKRKDTIST